jgi:hypothetical protein
MELKCLIAVLFFIHDAYILLIGLVWTYTLSNQVANKTWLTKMLNCLNLSHPPYGLTCYVVLSCWVRHVLTLVYSLASTIPGLLLRLGELWRHSGRFPGVLGVRSLQSAACGGIFVRCENSLFKFRLRLWFVIILYSCGTDFGIHNV